MRKILIILGVILLAACSGETKELQPGEYDELQKLYLDIDGTKTYEEVVAMVEESKLPYNEKEIGSDIRIKVAYEDGVASFEQPDPGDLVQITFNQNDEKPIQSVEYFNHSIYITLFEYIQGEYWDFRSHSQYAGYYINTYSGEPGEFTIKYNNGEEMETEYLKVDSKEEQFEYMYEFAKSKD